MSVLAESLLYLQKACLCNRLHHRSTVTSDAVFRNLQLRAEDHYRLRGPDVPLTATRHRKPRGGLTGRFGRNY